MDKNTLQQILGLPSLPAPGFFFEWSRVLDQPNNQVTTVRAFLGAPTDHTYSFDYGHALTGLIQVGADGVLQMEMEDRDHFDTFVEEVRNMALDRQMKEL